MKLSHQTIELKPTHPFVIARGGYAHHRNVIVRITDNDGLEGFGEAAPNRYYGESVATVIAALGQFKPLLERADPMSLESIEAQLNRALRGNPSAKSAVSARATRNKPAAVPRGDERTKRRSPPGPRRPGATGGSSGTTATTTD